MPCSPLKVNDVSEENVAKQETSMKDIGTIAQWNVSRARHLLQADLYLALFFDFQDGGDMFFRKCLLNFNALHGVTSQNSFNYDLFNFIFYSTNKFRPEHSCRVAYDISCPSIYLRPLTAPLPTTVATCSKALTVFARWNAGITSSNLTRGMDVFVRLFCVCVALCVQVTALRLADPPSKESYRLCTRSRNWKDV
jgi:hypothetical protein